jgi:cytochrome c-type biogenesis protein
MSSVNIVLAFAAGLLSFLSPCILPLIPAYISYLTGTSIEELHNPKMKLRIIYKSLGFVLGFSIVFIIMGASATSLGRLLLKYQKAFRIFSGIVIILFGLHTTGLIKIKALYREKRFFNLGKADKSFSSIIMGITFAAGWTPCAGPILGSILLLSSNQDTLSQGTFLLAIYSLGLALPFIFTAYSIGYFSKLLTKFRKNLSYISIISGLLMIIMGILIATNKLGKIANYLNFINI